MDLTKYREFCCNITAPMIHCRELTADTITESDRRIDPAQIYLYNGVTPSFRTAHLLTPAELPLLSADQFAAELTFYFQNPYLGNGYQNVTTTTLFKLKNTQTELSINLRCGNFVTVAITTNAANNDIAIAISPAGSMKWICRGVN